jgi:hypothetical protein
MSLPASARPRRRAVLRRNACLTGALVTAAAAPPAAAQTVDDGLLVQPRQLRTAVEYGRDRWTEYWEGTLRRTNGNIGTLTTESVTWMSTYGVTDRLSVVATLPYVRTRASEGVLRGQAGYQDLTVAAKYRVVQARVAGRATLGVLAVAGAGLPTSDYTPDFQPLSIGLGSRRAIGRAAVHLADRTGFFVDGSAGRAWRSTVRLDRSSYYTNGQLFETNEVAMPDVVDYAVGAGFQGRGLCLPVMLVAQRTLGGGDIRRQDMPFVSNRMDYTRVQARAMYTVPGLSGFGVQAGAARTLSGRNVGRSTALSGGVTYAVRL